MAISAPETLADLEALFARLHATRRVYERLPRDLRRRWVPLIDMHIDEVQREISKTNVTRGEVLA